MIKIQNLHKSFDSNPVLCGVSLDIFPDEIFVVVGKSGVGKSVLLKTIIGLIKPDRGSIFVDNKEITRMNRKELFEIRKKFGMLFQSAALFDSMTVKENLSLALKEHTGLPSDEIRKRAAGKLELVGLEDILDKYPAELSGGMKKRVGLARALMMEPEYILFDEPTTGLDPVMARSIDRLIYETTQKAGITSVIVTHDMITAVTIGTRIAMLEQGKIIFDGTPEKFLKCREKAVQEFINSIKNI
ncbi:ABC transporter ATP-binding protein [candidate division KSB1 bacterium]|nr:MAG: ABC transporter ATP-binding protein [candidate division KSB1 bacterium]